ncbi:EF-P 5-aminopentanol modification-associated protein YfmF [Massilioclostridium coli]|uniref:EF-P 5-aminopentanol modification-associated protein YfmF n=1 Tax=Massilioclostridium coli TaxID=1870991 RepID=UPI0022E92C82|nr:insulinase family protein [Massilioclostridium coli]
MYPLKREQIANGVYFNSILDKRFKTNRISVNLFLPLDSTTATERAIIPFLLRKGNQSCPDMTQLNRKLMSLYGAYLEADVRKIGDNQVLNLSISCLDDTYGLEGEALTQQAATILCESLLKPNLEQGLFRQQDLAIEKQNLIDLINSEINEKRIYAIGRLTELMCNTEPYGNNKYGSVEQAETLTAEQVTNAYRQVISTADIQIIYAGCGNEQVAKQVFQQAFANVQRENTYSMKNSVVKQVDKLQEVTERFQVAQSKMVLGFRTGTEATDQQTNAMRLMCAIYGGTPFSKLFLNVREKMSLCYYCAARMDKIKGIMTVDCGIENQNIEKAKQEILRQLELMKQGDFTQEEIDHTRLSLMNAAKTVGDSLANLEVWYLMQICCGTEYTPQDEIAMLDHCTREDIIAAANQVQLDTVYVLTSKEDDHE